MLAIYERRALLLQRQESGAEVYLMEIGRHPAMVVYSPSTATIITTLPRGATLRLGKAAEKPLYGAAAP